MPGTPGEHGTCSFCSAHCAAAFGADHKADHLARLNKIEGQIRGISRMVTDDRYCIDVLTQISAARTDPAGAEEKYTELNDTLRRALRV